MRSLPAIGRLGLRAGQFSTQALLNVFADSERVIDATRATPRAQLQRIDASSVSTRMRHTELLVWTYEDAQFLFTSLKA